jgi:hypothetical protein
VTPGEIAAIMVRLDHQDEAIGEIKSTVHEVLGHAKYTNGQVNELKQWRAIQEALKQQAAEQVGKRSARAAWVTPTVCTVGATLGATVLAHFL